MALYDTETCEECGHTGPQSYPQTSDAVTVFERYDGRMLCASCRVDARLEDNDFSED